MKTLKQLSLLSSSFLYLCIICACNKDKSLKGFDSVSGFNNPVENCSSITFNGGEVFDNTITSGVQYSSPTFSPFNDDELIFIKWKIGTERQLVKYNIQNGTETILCSSTQVNGYHLGNQVEWGVQNWIVFSAGTGNSAAGFKIKDDGTSLTPFLSPFINFNSPKFNANGDRILAWGKEVENSAYPSLPIYDLNGNVVDTFIYGNNNNIFWGYPSVNGNEFEQKIMTYWDHNYTPLQKGICYKSSDTTIQILHTILGADELLVTGMGKYQNTIYYLSELKGLYSFNLNSNLNSLLQEICDTRRIRSISVSSISGNILIEEVKRTKVDEFGGIDEQSNIYLLNPYTGEKKAIRVE